jgi:membrane-bound lytic murein transglycosylase D
MKQNILLKTGLGLKVLTPKTFLCLCVLIFCASAVSAQSPPSQKTTSQPATPVAPQMVTEPTTAQQASDAIATYKTQQLIDMAERSYQSGVENYRAGNLDAARSDFDSAVDMMLTSGLDIEADPQLSDEFDRVVDRINSLEMEALKAGNGFSPHVEAAPVEAGSNITLTTTPSLTAKVTADLQTTQSDMPLMVNEYVAGFINYFTNSQAGHTRLVDSLERAGKYKDMISRVLREEGVPQDLIYQAVTESGFQPQAYNAHSGAGGMWQFMPFSGYGLERNGWFDERFDPEKSTRAYARYIKFLYSQVGDWYLAMASYDWGLGNVQHAVQRTGYADFWELYRRNVLPAETKNYVPGVLAAIIMAKNPKQYGLDDVVPDPPVQSDTLSVDYSVDLRLVADVTGATLTDIVALNPSLLRMNTPRDMSFDLHLPAGTLAQYQKRINTIPEEKRTSWRFHVVTAGETLGGVADTYHVRSRDLATTNDLDASDDLSPGDELVVPVTAESKEGLHTASYKVRSGDTLVSVADRFGVTVANLQRWNHLHASAITPGRTLVVAEPVHLAPVGRVRKRSRSASRKGTAGSRTSAANAKSMTAKNASKNKN